MEEVRLDVVDNFLLPDELIQLRRDVHNFPWNPFETDIYQGQKIMSGMISDLPSDWRTKLDERIVSQANTLSQQNYSIFRGYINAWKCDEVSLPHHDGNHTTCIIYCNRDYNVKYGGETAIEHMDVGYAVCIKKLGVIGVTVSIMRKGTKLPHEISIFSDEELKIRAAENAEPVAEEEGSE